MIARCRYNHGSQLGQPVRGSFYGPKTEFQLVVGADYIVMGIGLFETILSLLVRDETGLPNWLPTALFELVDTRMPRDWEVEIYDPLAASGGDASNRWVARWGYPQLVREPDHSDRLVERDAEALATFAAQLRRRQAE